MKKILFLLALIVCLSTANAAYVTRIRPLAVHSGEEARLFVSVANHGPRNLDSVQVSVYIPELNLYSSSSTFDLDIGDTSRKAFSLEMPSAAKGYYAVKVTLYGDRVRESKYSWILVN
jgi:hypothetical protein